MSPYCQQYGLVATRTVKNTICLTEPIFSVLFSQLKQLHTFELGSFFSTVCLVSMRIRLKYCSNHMNYSGLGDVILFYPNYFDHLKKKIDIRS